MQIKPYFIAFLLLFSGSSLVAQETGQMSLGQALQMDFMLNGQNGPSGLTWIEGGGRYSFLDPDDGAIKIYDLATGTEELLFSSDERFFSGTDTPFEYNEFQWSADFNYLVFQTNFQPVWRNSGDADYYLYSIEKDEMRLVAKFARTAELSPDGKKVAYEKEGNLFVMELASGKTTQLTNDAQPQVYNGRFGWAYEEEFGLVQAWKWSPDSRYLAFYQTDEREIPIYRMIDFDKPHDEYEEIPYPRVGDPVIPVRIGIIDLEKGNKNQWVDLDLEGGYVPRIYWTAVPGQLAVTHLNRAQNELALYFAEAKSGKTKRILEEKDPDGWIDLFDFFAGILDYFTFPEDREEFFWISGESGHNHIYRYDYEGNLLNAVTEGDWDVVRVEAIDWEKDQIYFTSTQVSPLERHLYRTSLDGGTPVRMTQPAGRHSIDMSPNGKYYIDRYSSIDQYKQVELWSSEGEQLETLAANEQVGVYLESNPFAPRELFRFTTTDGQQLDGYLIKPLNFDPDQSYPLLLNIYGGPGAQSVYNEFGANGFEQYLAANGYVIASVNNRGSGGYGQDFMEIVYEQLGKYESLDFVETAQYLANTYDWVDGERMAIRGHSYGGYASSYTMVTHPGVFDVALVGAPVTDQRLYDNIYTERYMGLLPENTTNYEQSSVITHAAKLEGDMLIAHSLMDDNVHVINTYQLVKALTDAGKDVDLRIYPPGNHGVAYNWPSYQLLYQTYVDYLQEHLQKKA